MLSNDPSEWNFNINSSQQVQQFLYEFLNLNPLTAKNEKGNGLGLMITQEAMKLHDGKLFIESEVGKYTNMIIKFPYKNLDKLVVED